MKRLLIIQAKPNPAGKDRSSLFISPTQLAAEWVDLKNAGNEDFLLNNIELQHIAYTQRFPNGVWDKVTDFSGSLPVGRIVRVHSGGEIPLASLRLEDSIGVDYHIFSGTNYIWNNDRVDSPRLVQIVNGSTTEVDRATYHVNPQEGRVLQRRGDFLI